MVKISSLSLETDRLTPMICTFKEESGSQTFLYRKYVLLKTFIMFPGLDSLLLSQPRLSIICYLKFQQEADFKTLKENTGLSVGNLSIQLNKLKKQGYVDINKQFKGNYPLTICKITSKGVEAAAVFFNAMRSYEQTGDGFQTLSAQ